MEQVVLKLLVYGPLGIICVILLGACVVLYKAKDKAVTEANSRLDEMRKEFHEEVTKILAEHKAEMAELVKRHITKAETWVEKGNELATNLNNVLDSIARRTRG